MASIEPAFRIHQFTLCWLSVRILTKAVAQLPLPITPILKFSFMPGITISKQSTNTHSPLTTHRTIFEIICPWELCLFYHRFSWFYLQHQKVLLQFVHLPLNQC